MATIILWRKDSNNDYVDVKHPQMQSPSFYYNLASSIMRSLVGHILTISVYPSKNGNGVMVLLLYLNKDFVRCRTRTSCISWST
jgi:hypothetical protein